MEERKYEVNRGIERIACGMSLGDALILVEAMFRKYYMERGDEYSIKEMGRVNEEKPADE